MLPKGHTTQTLHLLPHSLLRKITMSHNVFYLQPFSSMSSVVKYICLFAFVFLTEIVENIYHIFKVFSTKLQKKIRECGSTESPVRKPPFQDFLRIFMVLCIFIVCLFFILRPTSQSHPLGVQGADPN